MFDQSSTVHLGHDDIGHEQMDLAYKPAGQVGAFARGVRRQDRNALCCSNSS